MRLFIVKFYNKIKILKKIIIKIQQTQKNIGSANKDNKIYEEKIYFLRIKND